MPETIYKLQPDRTLSLRGFNSYAAAATVHHASPTGFQISGTFRDPADFAVAVLYDADNVFEHPAIKYLPDFNFSGLTLSFSLNYSDAVQPIDSPKYNWIDWATLDCILENGNTAQVSLFQNALLAGTSFPAASATINLLSSGVVQPYDRVTLWYQNLAFDYIASGNPSAIQYEFYAAGTGTVHSITIAGTTYSYTETNPKGESSQDVASGLIGNITSSLVSAAPGTVTNAIELTVNASAAGQNIAVSASDGNAAVTLYLATPELAAENLVNQINATNWNLANTTHGLIATTSGAAITISAAQYGTVNVTGTSVTWVSGTMFSGIVPGSPFMVAGAVYTVASVLSPKQLTLTSAAPTATGAAYLAPRGGRDGNMIQMYSLSKTSTLSADKALIPFTGGSSAVTWNVTLDFTALGIDRLRQCWLTFAPSLTNGAAYTASEWLATFSNWTLTAASGSVPALQVAGPGSVRIEETDSACAYTGTWSTESGFYSKYFANATSDPNGSLTVTYNCQFTHDLYVGTSLYIDRAVVGVELDGTAISPLNCVLNIGSAVVTRRRVQAGVPAGKHTVKFTIQQAGVFYFDFLEAAVLSDVPDALAPRSGVSPALDFDTDQTYKLTPARLAWMMNKMGYAGPVNEYLGVFWWNERTFSDATYSTARITFGGTFTSGDTVFVTLNGTQMGKTVFPADTLATIANHFAATINETLTGAWASASGAILTITGRSPEPAYNLTVSLAVNSNAGQAAVTYSTAQVTFSGTFASGDTVSVTLNGTTIPETVSAGDTLTTIASRFATTINQTFAGAEASANGPVLTIAGLSPQSAYSLNIALTVNSSAGKAVLTSLPQAGVYGNWIVDNTVSPPINRGTRDWHADFYSICAAQNLEVTTACSMELVNPPAGYAAQFPDGTAVTTATGFGSLSSTQCAVGNSSVVAYQKAVYRNIAQLQVAAGLTPDVQYGEFLWWYFANASGMAYFDSQTAAAAQTALGRPLYVFLTPNDDPTVNNSADAVFLRNRLRDHVAALASDIRGAYPTVKCEVLWPYDVNYPSALPSGGGQLNYAVNLPVEWKTQSASGLDRIKAEALAFGTALRNLDLARQAIELFPNFGWPLPAVRYLVPVFGSATPWQRELAMVWATGIGVANLWAFDHVCLFNLTVPEPGLERRSVVKAA